MSAWNNRGREQDSVAQPALTTSRRCTCLGGGKRNEQKQPEGGGRKQLQSEVSCSKAQEGRLGAGEGNNSSSFSFRALVSQLLPRAAQRRRADLEPTPRGCKAGCSRSWQTTGPRNSYYIPGVWRACKVCNTIYMLVFGSTKSNRDCVTLQALGGWCSPCRTLHTHYCGCRVFHLV